MPSQYVHPKHPPDQEYRDDGSRDVNDPVANGFRFSKIEHVAMVAGRARAILLCCRLDGVARLAEEVTTAKERAKGNRYQTILYVLP